MYPKDPWTLQWRGWNLYSRGVWVLKIGTFEGSGYLGWVVFGGKCIGKYTIH